MKLAFERDTHRKVAIKIIKKSKFMTDVLPEMVSLSILFLCTLILARKEPFEERKASF